jgi:hypothetical protein
MHTTPTNCFLCSNLSLAWKFGFFTVCRSYLSNANLYARIYEFFKYESFTHLCITKLQKARESLTQARSHLDSPPNAMFVELVKTFLNIFKKKREDTQRRVILLKSALKKIEDVRRDSETIELELAATRVC